MGIRISEMEEATTFGADDYVPIVTNGTNKKALGQKIKDFIAGFFVSKSGDTMTGDLLIDKATPVVRMQDENLTVSTSATNGLTAETSASLIVRDTATQFFGRARGLAKTDGSIEFQLTARNMNTSGSRITNSFIVGVKKDGTKYYSVDDAAAFRTAIGLNGTFYHDVKIASGTLNAYTGGNDIFNLPTPSASANRYILLAWNSTLGQDMIICKFSSGQISCSKKVNQNDQVFIQGFIF